MSLMEMTPIKKMSAFLCIFFIYSFLTNLYSSSSDDCNGENDDIDNEEEEEEEAMSVIFISHFLPIGLHLSFRMSEPEPAEVPSTPRKRGRPRKNPVTPIPAKFVIYIYIEENLTIMLRGKKRSINEVAASDSDASFVARCVATLLHISCLILLCKSYPR